MTIAAAIKALEAGRDEDALDALLAVWKKTPAPALADAIEVLGAKLDAQRSRPTGKTVKDKEAKWHALAAKDSAADVGVLLATIAEVAKAVPLAARIAAMARRPPDPRIAMKLATMTQEWPIPGSTGIDSLDLALKTIVAMRDPRTRPVLEATQRQVAQEWGAMTKWFLQKNLEHYIAEMRKFARENPPPAKLDRVMALVRAEHVPATTTSADPGELFAAVYANPDDDNARSVLADLLQQKGDPRGEFIALQLAGAHAPGAKARRGREAELLRSHAREWLGPLEPAILKSGLKYERGFLSKCGVKEPGAVIGDRILEAKEWATITELDTSSWPAAADSAATRMPVLRTLVGVKAVMPDHPRLRHVAFEHLPDSNLPQFADVDAPNLHSLTIDKAYFGVADFAPFWSTTLGKQLEYFSIDCWQIDEWIADLHARVQPRGQLLRAVVSMHSHSPWRFWFEADGAIRCVLAWTFSTPERHFDELADRLESFPPKMFTKVRLDFKAEPSPRLAAAMARFGS
jgi:uncharacterized protein (TIGR02996 family)